MISRHVDVLTVGLLLSGIALYNGARHATMFLTVTPYRRITIVKPVRPPAIAIPQIPRIPFTRD